MNRTGPISPQWLRSTVEVPVHQAFILDRMGVTILDGATLGRDRLSRELEAVRLLWTDCPSTASTVRSGIRRQP